MQSIRAILSVDTRQRRDDRMFGAECEERAKCPDLKDSGALSSIYSSSLPAPFCWCCSCGALTISRADWRIDTISASRCCSSSISSPL